MQVHQLVAGTSTKVADARSSLAKRLAAMRPVDETADETAAEAQGQGQAEEYGGGGWVEGGRRAAGGGTSTKAADGPSEFALQSTRVVAEAPPPWQRGVPTTSDAWDPVTITIDLGDEISLGIELDDYNWVGVVRAGSPADRAGLRVGDVVRGWQGAPRG